MSWVDFYHLLVKYKGDLSQATNFEIESARKKSWQNPLVAQREAEKKYEQNYPKSRTEDYFRPVFGGPVRNGVSEEIN